MNQRLNNISNYRPNRISLKAENARPPLEISQFFYEHYEQRLFKSTIEAAKVKALFNNQILNTLSNQDFENILPHLELVSLSSGTNLYQPEEEISFVYFPENAVFSQFHILKDGRTIETAMIGNEGVTGFTGIFQPKSRTHFLQCSIGGIALRLKIEFFKHKIEQSRSFRELLFTFSNLLISQISQRVICNNLHLLDGRFCNWLLMLSDRAKTTELELTHDQIAGYLGVHRPSITHIAQTLREKKIIKYSRGRIIVLDKKKLENNACECYNREKFIH